MNILVTGATGFIGQHLIMSLRLTHEVHALIRPTTDINKLDGIYTFEFNDNIEELAQYMQDNKIEGVIHLASLYIAEHKSGQIKDIILSNVYFGTALLEACAKANIKWFINTGTIWQNYNVAPYSKEYCPVNLYAATKQSLIDIAKYYTETTDMKFCTLKLCDTYGPGDTRRKIFSLFKQIAETGETLDMSPGQQHTLKELAEIYSKATGKKLNINWGGREYRKREVMVPWKGKQLIGLKPSVIFKF